MGTALRAVNGMPRMQSVPGSDSSGIYDETLTVPSGGYPQSTNVTLPNSGEYDGVDLKVYKNGIFLEPGEDYDYVGTAPRTQIEILRTDVEENDLLHFVVEGNAGSIYDQTVVVGSGGITAGASITLPLSKVYNDVDLQIYLGGIRLSVAEDYNYIGSIPRTQIQMVFDLLEGERLRLRIEDGS